MRVERTSPQRASASPRRGRHHAEHRRGSTFERSAHRRRAPWTVVTGNGIDGGDTVASVGVRLVLENDRTMRARVEDNTCGVVAANPGTSGHVAHDLLVDLFDATASAEIEGLAEGPATETEFDAHVSVQNPDVRVTVLANDDPPNVSGVAPGTCQHPS